MLQEYVDLIVQYEEGTITQEDEIKLFQYLVDTEDAFKLQGHYGRHAQTLIDQGLIKVSKEEPKDEQGTA